MLPRVIICVLMVVVASRLPAQSLEVVKFDSIENLLNKKVDKVRVLNFWATFCAPCIKEMPEFEKANEEYKNRGVEIYLVSLDFVEDLAKVKKFIAKKGINSSVLLLDETDYNSWIDKVDKRWTGAIPATLFIDNSEQVIIERQLKEGELDQMINKYINP